MELGFADPWFDAMGSWPSWSPGGIATTPAMHGPVHQARAGEGMADTGASAIAVGEHAANKIRCRSLAG